MRFPKSYRLRSKADFASIRKGKRLRVGQLRITYRANQLDYSRLGLAISRKYGNAVQRNRLKRQLRNEFRTCDGYCMGIDMLVFPATNATAMKNVSSDLLRAITLMRRQLSAEF